MKKIFVLLTLLLAFILVLAACGGGAEEAPAPEQAPAEAPAEEEAAPAEEEPAAAEEEAPAAEEQVELTFSVWGDPEEIQILQEIADDFTAENPNISVTVTVSDWDTYWDKLQTTLAGGNPPDVFAMDAPLYPDYQSRGVLMNLQPMIDDDGFDLSAYYDEALVCYDTEDGYYGLPRDIQPSVMYINKDMFDEAGVPYPEDGWTWDDMIEISQQLTKDTDGDGTVDQYGLWADIWDMELLWGAMIWQYGGEILNEDFTQTLLAEDGAMDAWQTIYDMIFEYGTMPDPSVAEQFGDPFESGNAAMTPAGHWVVPYYSNVDFNWDVVPLPEAVDKVSMVNSVGFVIANDTQHPEESWAFLKHLVGEAGQEKITSLGLGVPTLKEIATSDAFLNQPVQINHQVFLDTMEYSRVKPCFRGYDEWATLFGDGMFSVWIGEAGLQETLDELVPQADAILQEAAE